MVFRQTEWTSQLWAGNIMRKLLSTSHRKVLILTLFYLHLFVFVGLILLFICCLVQITKQASEESLEYRVIVRTRALTAGSIMRRLTSMSPRQVGLHLFCLLLIFLFCIFLYFCPDYKTGFGGDYGVQTDRVDKSAVGWEHHEQVDKHESQKGKIESHKGPLAFHLYCICSLSRLQNWIWRSIWGSGGQS